MHDPLAAVQRDGTLDRDKIEGLLNRDPWTFTLPEITAMHVIFFEDQSLAAEFGLTYTTAWAEAFTAVVGGTITREKVRHGETVERSVRRYRGRDDVRAYRAKPRAVTCPRATDRESHRGRPGHRRAGATSTTSSSDPGDPDSESPAPATLRVRRPSGIVQTFEADSLERDDGILWATGRWRRRVGLNYAEIRYSQPGTYGFGAGEIVEMRI